MPKRYSLSKDGISRTTFTATIRLTHEQVEHYRRIIAGHLDRVITDVDLQKYIEWQMRGGLDHWNFNYNNEGEFVGEE